MSTKQGVIAPSTLSFQSCIADAAILGTFTGSRVSEYAQSSLTRGKRYNTVPRNAASGEHAGAPIAFTRADFSFYSRSNLQLSPPDLPSATYLTVRFRYTKGVRNFVQRTYAAIPSSPFCPVAAATRVLARHTNLKMPSDSPLWCYLSSARKPTICFLRDKQMTEGLRLATIITYPAKNHILNQKITAISSKSLRVFACLCLKQAGWDHDSISHHLRWTSDAVKYYIRQSPIAADDISASLLAAALSPTKT